jgi:hypothetical protein
MEIPEHVTIGKKYGPAMEITDAAEAAEYFEACVVHNMRFGSTREEAEKTERANLGYYAGYYDDATAQRVLALFGAAHPIFGAVRPTAEEAFAAGMRAAREGVAPATEPVPPATPS